MKAENEIWQVMSQGEVYQADLPTLKQWIGEGVVLPTDMVRKGGLKWIEAERAPGLRRVFTGEEQPAAFEPALAPAALDAPHAPAAVAQTHAHAAAPHAPARAAAWPQPRAAEQVLGESAPAAWGGQQWGEPELSGAPSLGSACRFHPQQAATLVCRACQATFCRACPNQVSASSVLLCPVCGHFCDPLETIAARASVYERQSSGFGLDDFRQALAYPFSHLASLLGGAALYGLLLLAGLRAQLLAWALLFGCISLVIRRVGYGKLERDFMPDFGDFSFWDDVIVPLFLGLGITIVTVGPTILLVLALLFGWFRGGEQTPFSLSSPTAHATRAITRDDLKALADGGTAEQEAELEKKVQAMTPRGQMAEGVKQSGGEESTALTVVRQLVARPGLVLLLALLALGWAVFYYPMALLVAGWTEDFKAVVNPLVGLDTMRHMGATYFKAFLMYLAVQVMSFFAGVVVALLTAPFQMPFVGNVPGKFIGGAITFYTSLVIACVLGLALFKSADRLGLELV
ncbi:MAG: hypothetical protein DMF67_18105 [Acidobacteria bacterium]|nr:MAG: hypothetical protein DMF67_18105 [Acidobacteriota bacterium]